jgi:hypothetical protein
LDLDVAENAISTPFERIKIFPAQTVFAVRQAPPGFNTGAGAIAKGNHYKE